MPSGTEVYEGILLYLTTEENEVFTEVTVYSVNTSPYSVVLCKVKSKNSKIKMSCLSVSPPAVILLEYNSL